MADDLKGLFDNFDESSTIKNAKNKLQSFIGKWKEKYPKIGNFFNEEISDYYFTYIKFPKEIRRMIYTTNQIENLNRKIRAATKNKNSFEKESRMFKLFWATSLVLFMRWTCYLCIFP
jgi:putative transposase